MNTSGYFKNVGSKMPITPERSLYPTQKMSGPQSISSRSNQSVQVICKTLYHTVEHYGAQIPVQVTEALKFNDWNISCSAMISNNGWAWLVIGRRLFIWQAVGGRHLYGSMCRELALPPSDLAHKANLVSVFTSHGNQIVSCIAVSPEGLVRYWSNIGSEDISVEYNAELQGQECESILCIASVGFIVATTTATILLIEVSNISVTRSLSCRSFSTPSGWLGGIGKRMSSLIFGGITNTPNDMKLVKVLVCNDKIILGGCSYKMYVLAGTVLQKWSLATGEPEKLIYQCNLQQLINDNFLQTVWSATGSDDGIETSFIDIQLSSSAETSIILFATAVNHAVSSLLYYAFITINVNGDSAPSKVTAFHLLKNIDFSSFSHDERLKNTNFLITGHTAYLYNSKRIICIPVIGGYEEADEITIPETSILGGSVINQIPVFFSRLHGFVSLSASDITPNDFLNNMMVTNSESSSTYDTQETSESGGINNDYIPPCKDGSACLKAAFLHYVSKRVGQCKAMVNETFSSDSNTSPQLDSMLDSVVIKVSMDLIDDVPARDPRWANVKADETSMNSTSSLQVQNQLLEKQEAWNLYLSFLMDTGLWKRLSAVTWNDMVVATAQVLAEHSEKLYAALVFRNLQMKYTNIMEPVIKEVLEKIKVVPTGGLTQYDLFYRQVSIIHKGLIQLCEYCRGYVHEDRNVQSIVSIIKDTNTLLLEVLSEVYKFRKQRQSNFTPNTNVLANFGCEVLPWTVAPGKNGLRDSIISQVNMTLKYGVQSVGNLAARQELLDQIILLITNVLEGWEIHLSSIRHKNTTKYENLSHHYETERLELIHPLVEEEEYERAAILAEKFCDFTILIELFETTNDTDRLEFYMDKFSEQEFSRFLFSYYIKEKKQGKLLNQFRCNEKYQHELGKFLSEHNSLAWIHAIFMGDFKLASNALLTMAFQEIELMRRKKSLLSLGKLAFLASCSADEVTFNRINRELDLIAHQEDLPENVLTSFGYDFETVRVFLPAELIRFYICEENVEATEVDFVKALDLLEFVEDTEEKDDLRHEIWCKSISRNEWPADNLNATNIIEFLNQFLFFRIVEMNITLGKNLADSMPLLPPILKAEELGDLRLNTTFQYLMKVGYEYYTRQ